MKKRENEMRERQNVSKMDDLTESRREYLIVVSLLLLFSFSQYLTSFAI